MSIRSKLICTVSALAVSMSISDQAWSQLKQLRSDYFSGPIHYSPADPWVRSKVFQAHTGHSGFFYNCDREECKRDSPYIKWTTNCAPQWPQRRGLLNGLRIDLEKVRQRIDRGSCGCDSCNEGQGCNCEMALTGNVTNPMMQDSHLPVASQAEWVDDFQSVGSQSVVVKSGVGAAFILEK